MPDLVQDTVCSPLSWTIFIALDKKEIFLSVGELMGAVVHTSTMLVSFAVKPFNM